MITVLGARGFIGSHLVEKLKSRRFEYCTPHRQEDLSGRHLGDIIYCIGLTSDFRERPLETVEAHVCRLVQMIRDCRYDSILYLSSTRLYDLGTEPAVENAVLRVDPSSLSDLYNVSKAMGEALLHACGHKARVARISNVYGPDFASDNFLSSVIREAVSAKRVILRTSLDSEKDYVSINDVVDSLISIATGAHQAVYNVAGGTNVSNRQLMYKIGRLTGCQVEVAPDATTVRYPRISIERLKSEFGYNPSSILNDLDDIVVAYERNGGIGK